MMTIIRVAYSKFGTFGVFLGFDEIPFCVTLERIWQNNESSVSCIPEGIYICERVISPKFGETFEVMNVPGRSLIRFHSGNLMADTHGCIILGERYEPVFGQPAVQLPGDAMKEFMRITKGKKQFDLEIKRAI